MKPSLISFEYVEEAIRLAAGRRGPRLWRRTSASDPWKERVEADPDSLFLRACIREETEAICAAPLLERIVEGRRLLAVSRQCLSRIALLDFGWRLLGDPRFPHRAAEEVLAVCRFSDWNPSHFLDTAEMSLAVAWALDAFGELWDPAFRRRIENSLIRLGLDAGDVNPEAWWIRSNNNWGQVCHAGMTAAALVLLERDPARAARVVHRAVTNVPASMAVYAPDGGYPEGPSYWSYGTTFNVLLIQMLENVLGTDFGLSEQEGFSNTGLYIQAMRGPTGLFFNYADGSEENGYCPSVVYWFAERFGTPVVSSWVEMTRRQWRSGSDQATGTRKKRRDRFGLELLWLPPLRGATAGVDLPLDWQDRGIVPVAVFRSGWDDPDAWFAGLKAGSPGQNHGHMDVGAFVLDAMGVRWAVDLGADCYHRIESRGLLLWDRAQNSDRWRVYRLNNYSHNTLTIGGALQRVEGYAPITGFSSDRESPWAEADLTSVYASLATRVIRRLSLRERCSAVITDRVEGVRPGTQVEWGMMTRADVEISGSVAFLRQSGRVMRVEAMGEGMRWEVQEADPPPAEHDSPNPGVRRLRFFVHAPPSGELALEVRFQAG